MSDSLDEPNIDIHCINGAILGRFKLKFRQSFFNWAIAIVVAGCGGHGMWLHWHVADLEATVLSQQKLLVTAQASQEIAEAALLQCKQQLGQLTTIPPTLAVGTRDTSKQKP